MAAPSMKQEVCNRYGRLLAVGEAERCDCGTEREVCLSNLRKGWTVHQALTQTLQVERSH